MNAKWSSRDDWIAASGSTRHDSCWLMRTVECRYVEGDSLITMVPNLFDSDFARVDWRE